MWIYIISIQHWDLQKKIIQSLWMTHLDVSTSLSVMNWIVFVARQVNLVSSAQKGPERLGSLRNCDSILWYPVRSGASSSSGSPAQRNWKQELGRGVVSSWGPFQLIISRIMVLCFQNCGWSADATKRPASRTGAASSREATICLSHASKYEVCSCLVWFCGKRVLREKWMDQESTWKWQTWFFSQAKSSDICRLIVTNDNPSGYCDDKTDRKSDILNLRRAARSSGVGYDSAQWTIKNWQESLWSSFMPMHRVKNSQQTEHERRR